MSSAVSNQTTLIASWTLGAVAIIATGVRYMLRGFIIKRWYWDDLFHGITLLLLLTELIAFTAGLPLIEAVLDPNSNESLEDRYVPYQRLNIAVTVIGFTGFWTTKLSFLFFYRLLFKCQQTFMRAWWVVMAFTILTYWVTIGGILAQCDGVAANLLSIAACSTPESLSLQRSTFIYGYCLNVGSDLAIMILPLTCISTLQLTMKRKLGIAVIFSFALLIIAFESLRLGESVGGSGANNNALWLLLESSVCVIVSCIPTFSSLRIWKQNGYKSSASSQGYPLRTRTQGYKSSVSQRTGSDTHVRKGSSIPGESMPSLHQQSSV